MRGSSVSSPWRMSEFKFTPHIKLLCKKLNDQNKKTFIVSNQPDIARGNLPLEVLHSIDSLIFNELSIKNISYCIHDDSDNCKCRKPKPGLIDSYIKEYGLIRSECVMIGDSSKDIEAAIGANIDSIFLETSYNHLEKDIICTKINSITELL